MASAPASPAEAGAAQETRDETCSVWMGDVQTNWDEDHIRQVFREASDGRHCPVSIRRPRDKHSGAPHRYCFCQFENQAVADAVLDELCGAPIPGSEHLKFRLNIKFRSGGPRDGPPPPPPPPQRYDDRPPQRYADARALLPPRYDDQHHRPRGPPQRRWQSRSRSRSRSPPPQRRFSRSPSPPPRRLGPPPSLPPPPGASSREPLLRVELMPGAAVGETPPNIEVGKLMHGYLQKWRKDKRAVPPEEVRADEAVYLPQRRLVAVAVDGVVRSFNHRTSARMERVGPVFEDSSEGAAVHRRSAVFLAGLALSLEFPTMKQCVSHVLRDAFVLDLYSSEEARFECNHEMAAKLQQSMQQLAGLDLPIADVDLKLTRAREIFVGSPPRASASAQLVADVAEPTVPCHSVSLPDLDRDTVHRFHSLALGGPLVGTTKMLGGFVLRAAGGSLVLELGKRPDAAACVGPVGVGTAAGQWTDAGAAPADHGAVEDQARRECVAWRGIHQLGCVATVNRLALYPADLAQRVALASGLQSAKARDVAGAVARRGARLVLVGGPVGSGTRPVAEALELELGLQGLRSTVVNLADFYATDADSDSIMPLVANRFVPGHVVACLSELLGGAAEFTAPTGKKIRRRGQIVVLEGAFALAESVLHAVTRTLGENDVFRVFAEPLAHVRLDDHTLVTSRTTRLLRTVAKESGEYGVPAETVLEAFLTVSAIDETSVFPAKAGADAIVNTGLPHELHMLKPIVERHLRLVKPSLNGYYSTARSLLALLSHAACLEKDLAPVGSPVRHYMEAGGRR